MSASPMRTSPADGGEKSRARIKAKLAALSAEEQDKVVSRIAQLILHSHVRRPTVAEAAKAADGSEVSGCRMPVEDQGITGPTECWVGAKD